ncbi:DNA primase family protein [Rhizobium sp. CNPSo 4039]|uniref:DNA primase family protein n=1 Tax=Rhizobium sp. CNPSo 4039 TaxID=3021409 RepID=UPI00254D2CB5|nr:DNA primase family protein [Rhizobium sp. CNPSo 4039]MDK4713005.1 phage/plasmid primase, P4 family [Rhizobium sp. CNPSo 4039]
MAKTKKQDSRPEAVIRMMEAAAEQRAPEFPETPSQIEAEPPAAVAADHDADEAVVEYCAGLDHSDTDNGIRMKLHFGDDLVVIAQEKAKQPLFAVWTGSHWDAANGGPKASAIAQRLGGRIAQETEYIRPNEFEQYMIDRAAEAYQKKEDDRSAGERNLILAAEKAKEAHGKRVKRRLDHAVTSKNAAKMSAALACLAPHIMRSADEFNADKMMVALRNVTLKFHRKMERRRNPRYRSLEETPDAPEYVDACTDSSLEVIEGHRRQDFITHIVPVKYDPKATCPKWTTFLNGKLPDPEVRKLVQISSGLGMLGITVQYLFFHYGDGANGKSVYMETLCRLLGEVSVTLPSTSLIGEGGSSGSASPDMARLYGRRLLRVKELPEGEDLRENLVKELTGGETITARDLFAGYMDFQPLFIAMMSGNGYPRITGTDDGIWRRMAVVHWPIKIAKEDRREFEEIVSSFEVEYPGILNWLIEGVHMFLREGLVIPEAVERATQEYRDDMDRTAGFVARCIIKDDKAPPLPGKDLYAAYCDDTVDQGGRPMNVTAFGRAMAKKFNKDRSSGTVQYKGIRLRSQPKPREPEPPEGRFDPQEPWPDDLP